LVERMQSAHHIDSNDAADFSEEQPSDLANRMEVENEVYG